MNPVERNRRHTPEFSRLDRLRSRLPALVLALMASAALPGHGPAVQVEARSAANLGEIPWFPDLHTALATAREERRLVLICFNMDGEAANERTLDIYHDPEFVAAAADAVCVLCSVDEHSGDGGACTRFPGHRCAEHRRCEKQARRHFYGAMRNNVAPQHLILYPDGLVAWHGIYEQSKDQILRGLNEAKLGMKASAGVRLRKQNNELGKLKGTAKNIQTAYMQVQAMLAQTPAEEFAKALNIVGSAVAERIIDDLAGFRPERATALLEAAAKGLRDKKLKRHAAEVLARVESLPAEPAEASPEPVPAAPGLESVATAAAPLTAKLASLGQAESLGRVYWAGAERRLEDLRGRVTVVFFFLPDMPGLDREIQRFNRMAAEYRSRGLEAIALTAAYRPTEMVGKLEALGFEAPVGTYLSSSSVFLYGVQMFPSWVVVDPDLNIVHRSPQDGSRHDWSAAEKLAVRMVESEVYGASLMNER